MQRALKKREILFYVQARFGQLIIGKHDHLQAKVSLAVKRPKLTAYVPKNE